jgi:hypothetical protein
MITGVILFGAMRLILLLVVWFPLIGLGQADPVSPESLPEAVVDTIKAESATATIDQVETYTWAGTTIYRVVLKLNDKPYMELHIAQTGKLVREDSLTKDPDDTDDIDGVDNGNDNASPTPRPKK